jgi:signal peptidase I
MALGNLKDLKAWKERQRLKRGEDEARNLATEARRILRRKQARIPAAVNSDVEAAAAAVEASLAANDADRVRDAVAQLDAKMDQHLGFARKSAFREYGESIGVAIAIALLLRAFVIEAFQIPSGSMIPTLEIGDHIFVSKFSYGLGIPFTLKKIFQFATPKRGDVIVFRYPLDIETDYIKRVVGLPGEKVEVRKNEIFINGRLMPREHVNGPCTYEDTPPAHREVSCDRWLENLDGKEHSVMHMGNGMPGPDFVGEVIPPDRVFVMGDNRDNSNDSRVWGTVPMEYIKGRALIVWWSRGPAETDFSVDGIKAWFGAIRWGRFFTLVK